MAEADRRCCSSTVAKQVLELMVTYSDVDGKKYQSKNSLEFGVDDERYSNNAIRKAILLTRYVHRCTITALSGPSVSSHMHTRHTPEFWCAGS